MCQIVNNWSYTNQEFKMLYTFLLHGVVTPLLQEHVAGIVQQELQGDAYIFDHILHCVDVNMNLNMNLDMNLDMNLIMHIISGYESGHDILCNVL